MQRADRYMQYVTMYYLVHPQSNKLNRKSTTYSSQGRKAHTVGANGKSKIHSPVEKNVCIRNRHQTPLFPPSLSFSLASADWPLLPGWRRPATARGSTTLFYSSVRNINGDSSASMLTYALARARPLFEQCAVSASGQDQSKIDISNIEQQAYVQEVGLGK